MCVCFGGRTFTVKPSEAFCKVCRNRIPDSAMIPLCEDCIAEAVKIYNERK